MDGTISDARTGWSCGLTPIHSQWNQYKRVTMNKGVPVYSEDAFFVTGKRGKIADSHQS